ncbi:MAG: hypothetical protein AB2A00_41145 [Myxococcota bacterium]
MLRRLPLSLLVPGVLACGASPESSGPSGNNDAVAAAEPLEVLAHGENNPWAVTASGGHVYWFTSNLLRHVSRDGGEVTTLAAVEDPVSLVLSDGHVYVSERGRNRIVRISADGAMETVVAPAKAQSTAVTDSHLYWIEDGPYEHDGAIRRVALGTSNVDTLVEGLAFPTGLVIHDGYLYWGSSGFSQSGGPGGVMSSGGGVRRMPLEGGPVSLVSSSGIPLSVVVRNQKAYFLANGGITAANVDGSGEQLLVGGLYEAYYLAADDDALYWSTGYGSAKVVRVPLAGGEKLTLVADLPSVHGVAVDDVAVYVAGGRGGEILRVAKDGSANRPTGPVMGPCPQPLPADVDSTPRADTNLELLALALEPDRITADQGTYDRLVHDVYAIRAANPDVAGIPFRTWYDGRSLSMEVTSVTAQSMDAGDYHAWDCLNDYYRLQSMFRETSYGEWVSLQLQGIYNTLKIAELYAQLPGALRVYASGGDVMGDGPTICVGRMGGEYHYVFDNRGGDCPSGCTSTVAYHFVTTEDGTITADGVWDSGSGTMAPEWRGQWCDR